MILKPRDCFLGCLYSIRWPAANLKDLGLMFSEHLKITIVLLDNHGFSSIGGLNCDRLFKIARSKPRRR